MLTKGDTLIHEVSLNISPELGLVTDRKQTRTQAYLYLLTPSSETGHDYTAGPIATSLGISTIITDLRASLSLLVQYLSLIQDNGCYVVFL